MVTQERQHRQDVRYVDHGISIDASLVDPDVPAPVDVVGHQMGDGAVRYDAMVRYMRVLAEASPFVELSSYAQSHEGRQLYYLTISSPENLKRLDEIKSDNAKLADPRLLSSDAEADRIIRELPGIAWMAYSIHGDELSSTDAALLVAHRLAAGNDDLARQMRDEMVIFIDPLQNPDGRERYLSQLQALRGKVPNLDLASMQHSGLWSAGRGNHYLFDLNRDWLTHVHPETQGRVELIVSWHPHLLVDSHEMGGGDTYLFDPPREPLNPQLTKKNLEWRARFAADQAAAFDAHGWSYYGGEWYEEWGPFYTNAWANHLGAIGILYEQAGYNGAAVKQASGEITSYDQAVHRQYESSMANLRSLLTSRREFLRDRLAARRIAVAEPDTGQVFVMPPAANKSLQSRFLDVIRRHGIEWEIATTPMTASNATGIDGKVREMVSLPPGSIIIRESQPQQRLLHAVLDFDPRMTDAFLLEERTEVEADRGGFIYDVTGWNIPMSYGLESYWARSLERDQTAVPRTQDHAPVDILNADPNYGWLIDCVDSDSTRLLVRLFDAGCTVRAASKPIVTGGHAFRAGAFLLRNHENSADVREILHAASDELHVTIMPVDTARTENGWDLGGRRIHLLHAPRVAIATQWPVSTTGFGAAWYLMDARLGMRCSPVNVQNLESMDLRMYNVLILPDAGGIGSILEGVDAKLREWVRNGGTLIAIGSSATALARDGSMSDVRLRRDVLEELDVYREATARERSALQVEIDHTLVWDGIPDSSSSTSDDASDRDEAAETVEKTGEALEREDAWQRRFSPSGAILQTHLDQSHWLCFGVGSTMPVMFGGSSVLMARPPVQTAARFAEYESLRLSGLLWPEARQRIADSAYATVERIGDGQIILFADDPFFRANMEGSGRFLINAVLLGPGMGTSQPHPW